MSQPLFLLSILNLNLGYDFRTDKRNLPLRTLCCDHSCARYFSL